MVANKKGKKTMVSVLTMLHLFRVFIKKPVRDHRGTPVVEQSGHISEGSNTKPNPHSPGGKTLRIFHPYVLMYFVHLHENMWVINPKDFSPICSHVLCRTYSDISRVKSGHQNGHGTSQLRKGSQSPFSHN